MIYSIARIIIVAQTLIFAGVMERRLGSKDEKDRDQDGNDAPETPTDEPRPPHVQDPPPQPDKNAPYVVHMQEDQR